MTRRPTGPGETQENSRTESEPSGEPSSATGSFEDDLLACFERLAPRGRLDWNFAASMEGLSKLADIFRIGAKRWAQDRGDEPGGSLIEADGSSETQGYARDGVLAQAPPPDDAGPEAGAHGSGDRSGDAATGKRTEKTFGSIRYRAMRKAASKFEPVLESWVTERALEASRPLVTELSRVLADGAEAMVEAQNALTFLAARVERLEADLRRRQRPVDGLAHLVDPPALGKWADEVGRWLAKQCPGGRVMVAECGNGDLAASLAGAGLSVEAAEPRPLLALEARAKKVPVRVGSAADVLEAADEGSFDAVVLAAVVDRSDLASLLDLLALAKQALALRGVLVVLGSDPGAVQWNAEARDLLPGRPLSPGAWTHLLRQAGLSQVAMAHRSGMYALLARHEAMISSSSPGEVTNW